MVSRAVVARGTLFVASGSVRRQELRLQTCCRAFLPE
jgi:hypothetical protein